MQKIKVKVDKSIPMMDIDEMQDFQGDLKTLSHEAMEKLQRSILEKGFRIPVFIWKKNILDGHQRMTAVKELLRTGVYELKDNALPYIEIQADDERDAKEMLLAISSSYGKMTEEGLTQFMELAEIEWEDIADIVDFPDINLEAMSDGSGTGGEYEPEVKFTEELLESHNYVVLYFDNDIDWLNAKTLMGIETVKSLDSREGYERRGVGRVVNGAEAIERIKNG